MKSIGLSLKEARRFIMASQRLTGASMSPLQTIEHLGYVQIDTISVIERAHHHVFWSRNVKYKPSDLDDLVQSRKVYEYWSHAASYLPMSEYRYSLIKKREFAKKESAWFPRDVKLMKEVLKRIDKEGPLKSKDFQNNRKANSSGWWDWKPAKKALERLFLEGELEITRREGFQKVYDLPERVIPSSVNTNLPSKNEYLRFLIERTLRHHGLVTASEVGYLQKKTVIDEISREIQEMRSSGEVTQVKVHGVNEPYYMLSNSLQHLPKVNSKIFILSPFDNFIIQRKKLCRFFDFDYQIECYVPEAKRKYGYFSLPVFYGMKPIARVDCKAERSRGNLLVQSIYYEKNVDQAMLQPRLYLKLKSFAKFNGCKHVVFN